MKFVNGFRELVNHFYNSFKNSVIGKITSTVTVNIDRSVSTLNCLF